VVSVMLISVLNIKLYGCIIVIEFNTRLYEKVHELV
jgi:hypothetical protein